MAIDICEDGGARQNKKHLQAAVSRLQKTQ